MPPIACRRLFVYGTLRRGMPNRYARFLARHATFEGTAKVRGFSKPGEVFRLRHLEPAFRVLDKYEEPDYRRIQMVAAIGGGRPVRVWIYRLTVGGSS
jgi:gamma-glutamylcyclotransferase (GGCT)/AIG2-like uncharacterized protein YtfP